MGPGLSTTIRDGFREALRRSDRAEPALVFGFPLEELPGLFRSGELSFEDEDKIYCELVERYQEGDRQLWGHVLLEVLAPALLTLVRRFTPRPPVIGPEDLTQQLILSVLAAAEKLDVSERRRFVERRLLSRTTDRLVRWLRHQRAASPAQVPFSEEILDRWAYSELQRRG